jgi:sialic acid synthase SpsE
MTQRLRRMIGSKSEIAATEKDAVAKKLFVSKRFRQKDILQQNNISIYRSRTQVVRINASSVQKLKISHTF